MARPDAKAAIQILPAPGLELMNLFVRELKSK
jgi:hypothetical protein